MSGYKNIDFFPRFISLLFAVIVSEFSFDWTFEGLIEFKEKASKHDLAYLFVIFMRYLFIIFCRMSMLDLYQIIFWLKPLVGLVIESKNKT